MQMGGRPEGALLSSSTKEDVISRNIYAAVYLAIAGVFLTIHLKAEDDNGLSWRDCVSQSWVRRQWLNLKKSMLEMGAARGGRTSAASFSLA